MMEPVDFSALGLSDERQEAIVARVLRASEQELTRRASGASAIVFLGTWARPALAAAAVLAAVCGTVLARTTPAQQSPGAGIAEALGLPTSTTVLLASNEAPTVGYMLDSEGETQ